MGNIAEVVVAVAFPLPKMDAVLLSFVRAIREKITDEPQYNDLPNLECQVFAGQVHLVSRNESQHALLMLGKFDININPLQLLRNSGE